MPETVIDVTAHHKIDAHEKVCAERYGNIWATLERIERGMADDRAIRSALDAATHIRFNTISNRMWTIAMSVIAGSLLGMGSLGFYLLTKGKI